MFGANLQQLDHFQFSSIIYFINFNLIQYNLYLHFQKNKKMTLSQLLKPSIEKAIQNVFSITIDKIEFQATRKEFEGDITMVIFPLLKRTND